jgi:hypothetical protein
MNPTGAVWTVVKLFSIYTDELLTSEEVEEGRFTENYFLQVMGPDVQLALWKI